MRLVLALALLAAPLSAHHSIVGQFDLSKKVTVRGTIVRVDWINPHPYVVLESTEKGATRWAFSTAPIAMLRKVGLTKERLAGNPGEVVTVIAHPALNGRPMGWVTKVTYGDGRYFLFSE
jgi:hypothetical protein